MKSVFIAVTVSVCVTNLGYSSGLPPQRPDTPYGPADWLLELVPLPSGELPTLPSPTKLKWENGRLISDTSPASTIATAGTAATTSSVSTNTMGNYKIRANLLKSYLDDYNFEMSQREPAQWALFAQSCLETSSLEMLEKENPDDITVLQECEVWQIRLGQWKKAVVLAIAIMRDEKDIEEN